MFHCFIYLFFFKWRKCLRGKDQLEKNETTIWMLSYCFHATLLLQYIFPCRFLSYFICSCLTSASPPLILLLSHVLSAVLHLSSVTLAAKFINQTPQHHLTSTKLNWCCRHARYMQSGKVKNPRINMRFHNKSRIKHIDTTHTHG